MDYTDRKHLEMHLFQGHLFLVPVLLPVFFVKPTTIIDSTFDRVFLFVKMGSRREEEADHPRPRRQIISYYINIKIVAILAQA